MRTFPTLPPSPPLPVSLLPRAALLVCCLAGACATPPAPPAEGALRAREVLWVADDFVVELWHNGHVVPLGSRRLENEIFGATVERVPLTVRTGDWLCFHVVNNRLRWGGCRFFAAAGKLAEHEFGFESDPQSPAWSACDDPERAAQFVASANTPGERRALPIAHPWDQGAARMRDLCGPGCRAQPLWGASASTWLKVRIE